MHEVRIWVGPAQHATYLMARRFADLADAIRFAEHFEAAGRFTVTVRELVA